VRWFSGRRYVPKLADARTTQSKVDEARQVLAAAEKEAAEAGERARDLEIHYTESLRALATAKHVREITIDVVGGTLPEGVEIVELSAATRAAADVDAVVVADGTVMLAPAPDGRNVPIGPLQEAIAKLPQLAAHARAVKLARRTYEALTAAMRAASDQLTAAEATFQARFAQLDQLRVADLDAFVQAQRLRLRPHIVASVQAVIEHAAVHLGQEQAELGKEWLAAIEVAKNNEELTATIERIELSSPQVTERIASEVRLLIANGVAGAAHDLQAELIAAVRPYGLPEEDAKTARFAVPHVDILPMFSGKQSKLGSAGQWLTGLFRSFETKRTETHAKVKAWIEQLRALANAEVLDAEPKLHAAMADAIGDELVRLLGRQAAWLSAQQGVLRDTVLSERKKLEPLAARRDHAQRGRDELAGELARTEAEQPAVAAAAAAAVAA